MIDQSENFKNKKKLLSKGTTNNETKTRYQQQEDAYECKHKYKRTSIQTIKEQQIHQEGCQKSSGK